MALKSGSVSSGQRKSGDQICSQNWLVLCPFPTGHDSGNRGNSNLRCGGQDTSETAFSVKTAFSLKQRTIFCLPRLVGKFVFIGVSNADKTLYLCEVQVYSQSSTRMGKELSCQKFHGWYSQGVILLFYFFLTNVGFPWLTELTVLQISPDYGIHPPLTVSSSAPKLMLSASSKLNCSFLRVTYK